MALQLVRADITAIDGPTGDPLLRKAFELFDLDRSGSIEYDEMYDLLGCMYPCMPHNHRKAAVKLIVTSGEAHQLKFEDFDETVLTWRKYADENDTEGTWAGEVVLGTTVLTNFLVNKRMLLAGKHKLKKSLRKLQVEVSTSKAQVQQQQEPPLPPQTTTAVHFA